MLDQLNNLSCYFEVEFDLYLSHFIVLLNPDFSCSKSFVSFSFDKVTTGAYSFVSVILNVAPDGATISGLPPCVPASKYWSPGCPGDVPLQRPQDVP